MNNLSDWLNFIQKLHPTEVDLGLDRIRQVAKRLDLLTLDCFVVTVGGTNGKGSTTSALASICHQAGYRVGKYTSPHLLTVNERIEINNELVSDSQLIQAFKTIEAARGTVNLSYFEYLALAAFYLFKAAKLDIVVLEVGLGGRLDAVNLIDSDLAIITNVSLDHTEWLGNTREAIGVEKAGIMRAEKPVIIAERQPPQSLITAANQLACKRYQLGNDFDYQSNNEAYSWRNEQTGQHYQLPALSLHGDNVAAVFMAVDLIKNDFPRLPEAMAAGLKTMNLPARCQWLHGPVTHVLDVSHNTASIAHLANELSHKKASFGRIIAVWSMLKDKTIADAVAAIKDHISEWHVATVLQARAASLAQLTEPLQALEQHYHCHATVPEAYRAALAKASDDDLLVVFGSFHTVAEVMPLVESSQHNTVALLEES